MQTYWPKIARGLSSSVLLMLAACGGGGGGDSGGQSPVEYTGNASAAVVTTANAAKLVSNVFGGDTSTIVSGVAGVSVESGSTPKNANGGLTALTQRLNESFRGPLARASRNDSSQRAVLSAIPVDDTAPCDSGSVRTVGTLNDNSTGTLTLTYNDCRTGNDTLTGKATVRVDAFDLGFPLPTDFTASFARLALRGAGVSIDCGGSFRVQVSIGTGIESITENLISLDNFTGGMTKTENFVFVDVYNNIFSPSSATATISGRLFDSVHGFVDVTTIAPLFFGSLTQLFPESGQMLMTGDANRAIRTRAESAALARLELDLDGDSAFESIAMLKWTDLSGPAGTDLADNDHDGMHNSWEVAYGLDPNNAADAALDKDGDGASNLAEYRAGTDPNSASSIPPAVGLSISMSDSPDPVVLGGNLTYAITVSNANALAASNVIVADALPPSVNLVSATPTQGSCTGTTSLSCNLGTLNGFNSVAVTIVVAPSAEGVVDNTASVSSSSFDPNLTDNSATSTTTVGLAVAGIQGLIDNALPGDTVPVGLGIYYGGLDFHGKNITLQSSAGPAGTIIYGNQGTAVRMGPGGAIKGFTITRSSGSFGAGIEVTGQGSLISGNVFDGNAGSSAAIEGNVSSPTIERNVFRNNTCDNQYLSGVVVFFNGSSPLIVNNIFENNQCRAINLTLPQGNTPQVVNNTFVGNRSAVRVDRRVPQITQIFRNNLIVQNGIGLEIENGATDADNPVWENNLVFGNTIDYQGTANQTGISGNISADPLFIDGAAGNYRLQHGSPAIDSGSAIGAPGVDFDGTPRPLDGNGDATAVMDIGAFEAP